jgi:alpha-L-fucosidase 2
MTLPYFDYYEACLPDYRRNAMAIYGCRGIFAPIAQAYKGEAPIYGGPWINWTAGAGWLGQLFFDYWQFTRDDTFLRDHAIPYLKEVAMFYEDFLFEDEDGHYVFAPSLSPENVPDVPGATIVNVNATMDFAVAREVLANLCVGCDHLGIDQEGVARWQAMLAKMPPYGINEDGAMKEWIHPRLKDNYHHRHLSHIYPLFPGNEITQESDPAIYEACRVAVEKRLVVGQTSQSGWSLAHQANIWARLSEGDRALACIEAITRSCVGPNLFTYHNDWRNQGMTLYWSFFDRIFQIDANFGIVAAVLEMLVYSNQEMVKILPALPSRWQSGSLKGASCRCGSDISIEWDMPADRLVIELLPRVSQRITIKFPGVPYRIETGDEVSLDPSARGDAYREIAMVAGSPCKIELLLRHST